MPELNVFDSDPRALLPVNPKAAILESFNGLEQELANIAKRFGYPSKPEAEGISAVQFLTNTGVISRPMLQSLQILKNVRDQAEYFQSGIDYDSASKYLKLVDDQRKKLLSEIKSKSPHNGRADA